MAKQLPRLRMGKPAIFQLFGILISAAILFSACAPVETPTATPTPVVIDLNQLYANPWTLVGFGDPNNPTVVQAGVNLTAEFSPDGQVSGFGGCNNFSGPYTAGTDGAMSIGPLATTLMACASGGEQETAYLTALQGAQSFSFNAQGRLEIKYASDQVLVFTVGARPLTGTSWVLTSMGDPAAPTPVPAGTIVTAEFSTDGYLSGQGGCNQYNATYTLEGDQLTLGPVASTMMACAAGMETEQAYLQALGTAQQLSITGSKLTITYDQGAGALIYTAASLPLTSTVWTLVTLNGTSLPPEISITALFTPDEGTPDAGIITGNSGCNSYNAGYTLSGNNLTIQPAASTMMFCAAGMDEEQSYLQALEASTSYQVFGDILVLTGSAGSLVYSADRTPLTGALWMLVSLGDVTNPQPPVAGSRFAAQFSRVPDAPSGVLTGTTGCNEYTAAFAASIEEIKINPPVSTQNTSCVPGLADQEKLYFLALNDAATYTISGNTLVMPYDDGKQALVFEGAQVEEAKRPPLSELNGTTWYLWFINNAPLAAGTSIYGQFTVNSDGSTGTLSGSAGCNRYVANFGQNLGVQASLSAAQVCSTPAGVMTQERSYIDMLGRAFGYWQTGDQLIINTGLGVLTYRSSQPPESFDQTHLLVGPTWFLVSYLNSNSTAGTQEPFTRFNSNGTLTGFTGCNTLQGNYTTNVQHITISNLSSTLSACPNANLQAQEDAMLGILRTARDYQVVDTVMQIVGGPGALNYSLTPVNRPGEVEPPKASFTGPTDVPAGTPATFDGTASSGPVPIVRWDWNFGDNSTGTGPVVTHVFAKPGSYRVTLTVTDQRGVQNAQQQTVNATTPAQPSPTPTKPPAPTASPTQAPESTPTAQPTEGPQPTAPPEPTQPPEPTATPEIAPPIALGPEAAIQGPSSGFVGEPVTFDASGSTAGTSPIASYAWSFGDGTSAGGPVATTIFNSTGSYQVSLVVTDEGGLSSETLMAVTISTRLDTPDVWSLTSLGNQGLVPGTAITLQFQGGRVAGFSGCNSYNGGYTVEQNEDGSYTLAITGLTNTAIACPGNIMQQEQNYLSMLGAVTTGQIQGSTLNLSSPQGSLTYNQH